ncbi:hypothetical protein C7T96_10505 [Nitratireductor sp. StC3]|nr:hypothetical protein C7T96_10505 [Nitratireductor sp. StC3]
MDRTDRALLLATVLFFVALGAAHHVYFSIDTGGLNFFKNAYDEDTYALFPNNLNTWRIDRYFSAVIFDLFKAVFGSNFGYALIAADIVLIPACFLAILYAVSPLLKSMPGRVAAAVLILLSQDLFSLGNIASLTHDVVKLSDFRLLFGAWGETMVPPIDTAYLNFFKSLEPQLAYVSAWIVVGCLVRFVLAPQSQRLRSSVPLLLAAQIALTGSYSVVGYPVLLLEFYVATILVFMGRCKIAGLVFALCLMSIAVAVWAASQTLAGNTALFASRLPMISTAVLGGLVVTGAMLVRLFSKGFSQPPLWLGLGLAGLPVALMNQQVLTGLMVSTKDWERYINHPFLAFGAILFWATIRKKAAEHGRPGQGRWPVYAAIVFFAAFAIYGTKRTYGLWENINLHGLAIARAIDNAEAELPADAVFVLDSVGLAPQVALRRGGKTGFLVDYTDVFRDRIPSIEEKPFSITRHGYALFEYWRLRGMSADGVSEILMSEHAARGGFFSGFFFNICDYWHPCTDSRAVKSEAIGQKIPDIVEAYRAYADKAPDADSRAISLLITIDSTGSRDWRGFFDHPVAQGSASSVVARAYPASKAK